MCPEYLQFFRHERCWLDCGFVASNTLRNLGNKNEQMRSPTCPVLIPGKLKSEAVKLLCAAPAELRWHNSNCISMNTKLNSSLYAGYCWMLSGRYRAPCTVSTPASVQQPPVTTTTTTGLPRSPTPHSRAAAAVRVSAALL